MVDVVTKLSPAVENIGGTERCPRKAGVGGMQVRGVKPENQI